MAIDAGEELDPEFRQIATLARAAKLRGDDNYIMRRGAILHSDVAILAPLSMKAPGDVGARRAVSSGSAWRSPTARRSISTSRRCTGRSRGCCSTSSCRAAATAPTPGHDDMVRQWYRATAAWMQLREDHDKLHLDRARAIFPSDPDILFLSACQRETYAGAPIQTAVRSRCCRPA